MQPAQPGLRRGSYDPFPLSPADDRTGTAGQVGTEIIGRGRKRPASSICRTPGPGAAPVVRQTPRFCQGISLPVATGHVVQRSSTHGFWPCDPEWLSRSGVVSEDGRSLDRYRYRIRNRDRQTIGSLRRMGATPATQRSMFFNPASLAQRTACCHSSAVMRLEIPG